MPSTSVSPLRRAVPWLAAMLLALGLTAGPFVQPAHAEGAASTFVADANLALDGALRVTETITFASPAPAQVKQTFETRVDLVGSRQYVQSLGQISATAGGAAATPAVSTSGRLTTVSVPTGGADQVTISYVVTGATVNLEGGTALRWPLLQGLSVPVTAFSATVAIPTQFSYVKCTAGPPNSTIPCTFAAGGREGSQTPTFGDGPRGAGETVAVDIGFPAGTVKSNEQIRYQWTVGRAFSAAPLPLALALGVLVLGGLAVLVLHRRSGADALSGGQISKAGEFVPTGPGQSEFRVVSDIRPGHVGTVADERVDPIDVTASLVDLAVRGHLHITELSRDGEFARTDWLLKRSTGADQLRPFEQALLDGVVAPGETVRVSELGSRVQESIAAVQSALYDEVVEHGWYEHRPDSTRGRWTQIGIAALVGSLVVTALLAAFTTLGLVGVALIVLALALVFVGQEMPARTAKGAALLSGLGALRSDLLSHPTDQMPPGAELTEISEVLPYAIVLGGTDRWLDAFVASDTDEDADSTDLAWYHGPADWHLRDFPDSMRNFITTVSGSLFAR